MSGHLRNVWRRPAFQSEIPAVKRTESGAQPLRLSRPVLSGGRAEDWCLHPAPDLVRLSGQGSFPGRRELQPLGLDTADECRLVAVDEADCPPLLPLSLQDEPLVVVSPYGAVRPKALDERDPGLHLGGPTAPVFRACQRL